MIFKVKINKNNLIKYYIQNFKYIFCGKKYLKKEKNAWRLLTFNLIRIALFVFIYLFINEIKKYIS